MRAAGGITLVGYGFSQMLRLVSNVVLARLLFPEAFGTMAILQTILVGVAMLTDVGLSMSLIRSKQGNAPHFINTIWTLQIIKGLITALLLLLLAVPVAQFYRNELLAPMLAAISLVAIISGFKSTKIDSAIRNMQAARVTFVEVGVQIISLIFTSILAWYFRSPWALVWGNVANAVIHTTLSHCAFDGPRNRLAWSKSSIKEILGFSSWVLLGSCVTFLSGEGLNLLRAKFTTLDLLGQIGIATTLTLIAWNAVQKLAGRVLFPAYSETLRERPESFSLIVKKTKRIILSLLIPSNLLLFLLAPYIIELLYDHRYQTTVTVIQIMCIGLFLSILNSCYVGVFDALGKPQLSTLCVAIEGILRSLGIFIGYKYMGPMGVVIGTTAAAPVIYIIINTIYRQHRIESDIMDIAGIILFAISAFYFFELKDLHV